MVFVACYSLPKKGSSYDSGERLECLKYKNELKKVSQATSFLSVNVLILVTTPNHLGKGCSPLDSELDAL